MIVCEYTDVECRIAECQEMGCMKARLMRKDKPQRTPQVAEPNTLRDVRRQLLKELIEQAEGLDVCRDITDDRRHYMHMPIEHVAELADWLRERLGEGKA